MSLRIEAISVAFALLACHEEERRFREVVPAARRVAVPDTALKPGPQASSLSVSVRSPRAPVLSNPYEANAWGVAEGKRLFTWFNCVGCHANGGGGMGPALIDDMWRYGSEPHDIYASITQGRPNGMPAFGERITDQQAWQLVSYVRSLGKFTPLGAQPGRSDIIGGVKPESQQSKPSSKLNPGQK